MPLTSRSRTPIDTKWLLSHNWWKDVDVRTPQECWEWQKSTASHGYGQTWDGNTVLLAHRVAWTLAVGPIPYRMTIDHKCRNRKCCNPNHLRLLTNLDNARDNGQNRKTHCPRGHAYDEANTRYNKHGHRHCRACVRERRLENA